MINSFVVNSYNKKDLLSFSEIMSSNSLGYSGTSTSKEMVGGCPFSLSVISEINDMIPYEAIATCVIAWIAMRGNQSTAITIKADGQIKIVDNRHNPDEIAKLIKAASSVTLINKSNYKT